MQRPFIVEKWANYVVLKFMLENNGAIIYQVKRQCWYILYIYIMHTVFITTKLSFLHFLFSVLYHV